MHLPYPTCAENPRLYGCLIFEAIGFQHTPRGSQLELSQKLEELASLFLRCPLLLLMLQMVSGLFGIHRACHRHFEQAKVSTTRIC